MEPRIQYATTSDGVRIAYTVTGSGPPLVYLAEPVVSHVQLEWEVPLFKRFFGRLASTNTLIRFDGRGGGMSDRVLPMTLEESALDIQAVIERLQLNHFALTCAQISTPAVVLYAAQNANRIRRIVFIDGFLRTRDMLDSPQARAVTSSASIDFEMATETLGPVSFGPGREESRAHGIYVRSCVGPEFFAHVPVMATFDATPYASSLTMPALAIRHEGLQYVTPEMTRDLVSRLPDARLVVLPGLWADGPEGLANQLVAFINEDADLSSAHSGEVPEPGRTDATMRTVAAPEKSFSSGRYVVRRVLGEGGQKIVYLVDDTALDRECALSVIKRDLLEPDHLLRLQREAQSMARLGAHSTIVTIFDIGEEDGTPYIVCEYVPGGDLRHELRTVGTLSIDRALAIAADVAEALVIAHAHGVVHRDVKPSNVWIRENGTAKLGDFGLAFSPDRSRLTMPGTFLGTASYMPPERALGHPAEPRSDLYSLGAVLYEMVTGAPPFVADDALSVISQHVNATPVPPIAHNPDLPPALDALILHLLAKSQDDRPASASEVAAELRSLRRTA